MRVRMGFSCDGLCVVFGWVWRVSRFSRRASFEVFASCEFRVRDRCVSVFYSVSWFYSGGRDGASGGVSGWVGEACGKCSGCMDIRSKDKSSLQNGIFSNSIALSKNRKETRRWIERKQRE